VRRMLGLACVLAAVAAHTAVAAEEPPTPPAAPPPAAAPAAPAPAQQPAPTPTPPTDTPATSGPTTTVKAARLALVGRTRERLIYIDKPTVRKISSDKFELWAEMHADNGERIKFLMQLNCADRSYLVKSEVDYDADGQVVLNEIHPAPALQYVVPDSTSEFIHQAICRETAQ